MQRQAFLHELDVPHQPDDVIGEELHGGDRADAAGIQGRRMDVPALHQAEHLACHAADVQRLAIKLAGERIQGPHDVGDRLVAVEAGIGGLGPFRLLPDAGIRLLHHLLAEVDADQVVLENVVVEHVLGGFAQVDDPLAQRRRLDAEGHVLGVAGARRMVVAADAADAAGDEVRVARVLPLHEDAVAAEDRRSAVALDHFAVAEVDFGEDAQAAHDPRDRIPIHLDQVAPLGVRFGAGKYGRRHGADSLNVTGRCAARRR